jgi:hypothetical protein
VEQKDETRVKHEKLSAATAACDVLRALGSKAASAAIALRKTVEDDKPPPPGAILEIHGALLGALMDKRVQSTATERKKLFGIPLETEKPTQSQMRALVKRFELAFLRPSPSSATNPSQP